MPGPKHLPSARRQQKSAAWARTHSQESPDLLGQVLLGERLGQEGGSRLEQPPLKYLRGEPRHVDNGLARPPLFHVAPQLAPIHSGHLDVGEDQMDATGVLLDRGDGLPPVSWPPWPDIRSR